MNKLLLGLALVLSLVGVVLGLQKPETLTQIVRERLSGTTSDDFTIEKTLTVNSNASLLNEATIGSTTRGSIQLDLAAGDEQECWRNGTGANVRVQYAELGYLSGSASSSFDMFLFATTSTSVPAGHAYVALAPIATSSIIGSTLFATSTVASTTNNLVYALTRNGQGLLNTVAPNMSVCLYLQQGDLVGSCTAGTEAGKCESATSTNRGFNPFASFDYRRL